VEGPDVFPEANSMQRAVLRVVIGASWEAHMNSVTTCKASERLIDNEPEILSLPDNFWKEEVLGWEQVSWAGVQFVISQYASGAKGSDAPGQSEDKWWIEPKTEGEKKLCSLQKMRRSGGFV
jgi:hypothetical protein